MEKKNDLFNLFLCRPSDWGGSYFLHRQVGFRLAAILPTLIWLTALMVQPAFAGGGGANLYVATTGTDTGNCLINSCRTIAYAMNQASSYDNIHIAAGTYTENLTPNKNLDFYGAGMNATILDGGGLDAVIYDSSYDLIIMDLTIRNGYHSGSSSGGGIAHWGGTLNLTRVKFLTNHAHFGGGLFSSGPLTMTDCVVTGNSAETYDTTGGYGGGIFLQGTGVTASLVNVTISGNTATGSGGGLHNQNTGTLNLTNVTISGNTAQNNGALSTTNSSILNLTNSTIADNHFSAGGSNGGIGNWATINFKNTIVAANDGTNCFSGGTLNTLDGNLDSGNTCSFTHPSDYRNTDPLLGPLADNGGPVQTRALLTGSYAIDGGTNTGCPATDARGVTRPKDGNSNGVAVCDIGAYEAIAITFVDVPANHPFFRYVEGFYAAGITTGCSQSPKMYCPDNPVTRGEMAVFIERALGRFSPTPSPSGMFTDVTSGPFKPFIEQFYNDGITTGCVQSPLMYCPNNSVTRGEMAVFIVRAFGIPLP